jgi:metal-responsive CopG/Arc/MetJ family transcriptional regulator
MRMIIDLADHQVTALTELCEREHISQSEAIRRAIDTMLAEKQKLTRDDSFGTWASRGDSRDTVNALRREWSC